MKIIKCFGPIALDWPIVLARSSVIRHLLNSKKCFFLCWRSDSNCDANFSALFNTDEVKLIDESRLETVKKSETGQIYTKCCWFHEIWKKHLQNLVPWELFKSQALQFAQLLGA